MRPTQNVFKESRIYPSPVAFSTPQELSIRNVMQIDESLHGVVIASKFAAITYTGASAIEAGPIRSVLLGLSHILEPSYFFQYRIVESEAEALKIRDALRSEIVVRNLGE